MVNPFKKYNLERAEFETPQKLSGVSALKQEGIDQKAQFSAEELLQYNSVDEFRAANNGHVPSGVSDFYRQMAVDKLYGSIQEVNARRRAYDEHAIVHSSELGTVGGAATNAGLNAAASGSRWVGFGAAGPDTLVSNIGLTGISDEIREIHYRLNNPETAESVTSEERAKLQEFQPAETRGPANQIAYQAAKAGDPLSHNKTYEERIDNSDKRLDRANRIAERFQDNSLTKSVNRVKLDRLMGEMGESWENNVSQHFNNAGEALDNKDYGSAVINTLKGIARGAVEFGDDFLNNPQATLEFVAEQAPPLVMAAVSKGLMTSATMSYAIDTYRERIGAFEEKHDRPATNNERSDIMSWSLTAGYAETIGNLTIFNALKKSTKFNKAVQEILDVDGPVGSIARSGVTRTAGQTLAATKAEAITEGYQTAVETSDINPFDGTADWKEVAIAAALGGISGGGIAGAGSGTRNAITGLAAIAQNASTRSAGDATNRTDRNRVNSIVKEAFDTGGHPREILDDSNPRTYDPASAAMLFGARAADFKDGTDESRAKARTDFENLRDGLNNEIVGLKEELAQEENKTERKKLSRKIHEKETFLREGTAQFESMVTGAEVKAKKVDLDKDTETALDENAEPEAAQQAIERTILSMAQGNFTPETKKEYLNKIKNSKHTTEAQKEYISSIEASFTAEHAANNMQQTEGTVSDMIMNGARGFKGLRHYRDKVYQSLQSGNLEKVTDEITQLHGFALDHTDKLTKAKETREKAIREGKNHYMIRDPNSESGWIIKPYEKRSDLPWKTEMERSQLGGFAFVRKKGNKGWSGESYINQIEKEVAALNAMGIELTNATRHTSPDTQIGLEFDASVVPTVEQRGSSELELNTENQTDSPANTKGKVERIKRYNEESIRNNPDKIFVFGDNLIGKGKRGQAVIRDEPNAVGIPTKRLPSMNADAFFGQDVDQEKQAITEAVDRLVKLQEEGKTIVLPEDGLGTGLAKLSEKAPEVAAHLEQQLARLETDSQISSQAPQQSTTAATPDSSFQPDQEAQRGSQDEIKDPRWDALVAEGKADFKDGIYYIKDANATKYIGGTNPDTGAIFVNVAKLAAEGLRNYIANTPQKTEMLRQMGVTADQFAQLFNSTKEEAAFVRDHELSHRKNDDGKAYPRDKDGNLDLMNQDALDIEIRATMDALTEGQKEQLAAFKQQNSEPEVAAETDQQAPEAQQEAITEPEQQTQEEQPSSEGESEFENNTDEALNNDDYYDSLANQESEEEIDIAGILGTEPSLEQQNIADTDAESQAALAAQETEAEVSALEETAPTIESDIGWVDLKFTRRAYEDRARALGIGPAQIYALRNPKGKIDKEAIEALERGEDQRTEKEGVNVFKSLRDSNPLAKWFKQRSARDTAATFNPLTTIANFASKIINSEGEQFIEMLQEYLDKDLNNKQINVLRQFFNEFHNPMDRTLRALATKAIKKPEFIYEDMLSYFEGNLPENFRTAMIAAMYTTIAEEGGKSINTRQDINAILGRDSRETVPDNILNVLGNQPWTLHSSLARKLGKRAMSFMNITTATDNIPADKLPNLEVAMGNMMIGVLLQMKLMNRKVMTNDFFSMDSEGNPIPGRSRNQGVPLVYFAHKSATIKEIVKSNSETGNVVSKLFGVEEGTHEPSSKPGMISGRNIPTKLKRILKAVSKRPHKLNEEVGVRLANLSTRMRMRVSGARLEEDGWIHPNNVERVKAQNESILRDINGWLGYRTSNGDAPFYLRPIMYVQQRVGLAHTIMNMQASKVYRHLGYPADWETQVNAKNENAELRFFKIAIAQGMGFSIDKKKASKALEHFDGLMSDSDIQAALDIIENKTENFTEAEENTILKAVKIGGENLWSFHSLVELAKYRKSQRDGKEFTTNVMIEVDGVTNGPAITNLMLGVTNQLIGSKIGFIPDNFVFNNEQIRNHADFKSAGGKDLYESLAHQLQLNVNKLIASNEMRSTRQGAGVNDLLDILFFTGNFADFTGRQRVKTPLTQLGFGAGIGKTMDQMTTEFVMLYYEAMEKAINDNDVVAQEQIMKAANRLIGGNTITNPRAELSLGQQRALGMSFRNLMETPVKEALDSYYKDLIERRKDIYDSGKAMYEMYMALRDFYVERMKQDKIANGTIRVSTQGRRQIDRNGNVVKDKNGKAILVYDPIDDLTKEDYAIIDKMMSQAMPAIHTALSKAEDKDVGNYGLMLPSRNSIDPNERAYRQSTSFSNTKFANNDTGRDRGTGTTFETNSESRSWSEPGVRAVVLAIHATDSAIASETYGEFNGLNIHDAIGFSIKDILDGSRKLNKNAFNIIRKYSLGIETYNALNRIHKHVHGVANSTVGEDTETGRRLKEQLRNRINNINLGSDRKPKIFTESMMRDIGKRIIRNEIQKLMYLRTVGYVSQYSFDGTEHVVSQAEKEAIDKKISQLMAHPLMAGTSPQPYRGRTTEFQQSNHTSPWGVLGSSTNVSDTLLAQKLEELSKKTYDPNSKEKSPVMELYDVLWQRVKRRDEANKDLTGVQKFELDVLKAIKPLLDNNIKINIIDRNTPFDPEISEAAFGSLAFYNPKDNSINFKSFEFQNSMITTESVIHELIHAAVSGVIHQAAEGNITNSVVMQGYNNLQSLLKQAQEFVAENNLTQFANATSNIDELLSWGMTNAAFQEQVLAKIKIADGQQQADQVRESGFFSFVKSMINLIFRRENEDSLVDGMGSLIASFAMITKEVAKQDDQNTDSSGEIKSMAMNDGVYETTPSEIFDALPDKEGKPISPAKAKLLKSILNRISDGIFADGAFKERVRRNTPFRPEDLFAEAIADNDMSFTSGVAGILNISEKERYVMESIERATREVLARSGPVRAEVNELFEAISALGPEGLFQGNWNDLSIDQQAYYEGIYNEIFRQATNQEGKNLYLSRFMAAGMVYGPLMQAMANMPMHRKRFKLSKMRGIKETFDHIREVIASMFQRWVAGNRNSGNYSEAVIDVAAEMVSIEKKYQMRMDRIRKRNTEGWTGKVKDVSDVARNKLYEALWASPMAQSRHAVVRASTKLSALAVGNRLEGVVDGAKKVIDLSTRGKSGFFGNLFSEVTPDDNMMTILHKIHANAKNLQQRRVREKKQISAEIHKAFGEKLTQDESESLTKGLVRIGAHVLMNGTHTLEGIRDLFIDSSKRQMRIDKLVSQLPAKHRDFYVNQAKALGIHMSTGLSKSPILHRNAYNIANYIGIAGRNDVTQQKAANAEPLIDELATLYAIEYLGATDNNGQSIRANIARVIDKEINRTLEPGKQDGITTLLSTAKAFESESLKTLFKNDKTQTVKGYTKDEFNPYIDVVAVKESEVEMAEKAGYKAVPHELLRDQGDPRKSKFVLMYHRNGGLPSFISGVFSNTDGKRQGTELVGNLYTKDGEPSAKNRGILSTINKHRTDALTKLVDGNLDINEDFALVPIFDNKGGIMNWRYLMSNATKDSVLERNNDVGDNMGNIGSSIVDKSGTALLNKGAVAAVRQIYDNEYLNNKNSFIVFGPNSTDPEIKERYRLLPEETKREIRKVWGSDQMMIRKDAYNILFGYRTPSLASTVGVKPKDRNWVEDLFAKIVGEVILTDDDGEASKRITARRGAVINNVGQSWNETVRWVKDTLVIRTGFTLLGNEISNISILLIEGMSLVDIMKYKFIGWTATKKYVKNRNEKESIERMIARDFLSPKSLKAAQDRILQLEEQMRASEVRELFEQGMYQTIVEDVNQEDDPYSYGSGLKRKLDTVGRYVPKPVKAVGDFMLMSHDTGLYKLFNDATVMSDFTSRYALNEMYKNNPRKNYTLEERMDKVRNRFVDYDIPTSRQLQWLNDKGLIWFSKYYLRIQHVILELMRENPARAIMVWAMMDQLLGTTHILDSLAVNKDLMNMTGSGALEAPGAVKEMFTMYAGDNLFFD